MKTIYPHNGIKKTGVIAAAFFLTFVLAYSSFAQTAGPYDPNTDTNAGQNQSDAAYQQGQTTNSGINSNSASQSSGTYQQGYNSNGTIYYNTSNQTNDAYNQGQYQSDASQAQGYDSNSTIYYGTDYQNSEAQYLGGLDNSYANQQGLYTNTPINSNAATYNAFLKSSNDTSYSAYSQWLKSQGQLFQNGVKSDATTTNSGIGKDIYTGKSYTDVNTGLYNAAQTLNGKVNTTSSCSTKISKIGDIFTLGACIINRFLISSLVTLALIYFFWGVVQYVLSADSAEERNKSKQVMLWGILAMFVIVSVWGIVAAFRTLLGI